MFTFYRYISVSPRFEKIIHSNNNAYNTQDYLSPIIV